MQKDCNISPYQESVVGSSPQQRQGEEGLDALQPSSEPGIPGLVVREDDETGKAYA